MYTTNFYKSFSKNILLYMSSRLSKIRSVHTYAMPRTVYFGWICTCRYSRIEHEFPHIYLLLYNIFLSKCVHNMHLTIDLNSALIFLLSNALLIGKKIKWPSSALFTEECRSLCIFGSEKRRICFISVLFWITRHIRLNNFQDERSGLPRRWWLPVECV